MNPRVLALVAAAGATVPALAGIITTSQVVAYSLMPAPGTAGAFYSGSNSFGIYGIDAAGTCYFRSTLIGGDASTSNPYTAAGFWSGTNTSNVVKVVRDGEAAPGTPAGVTFGTSATTSGMGSSISMTSGNTGMFGLQFLGSGVTSGVNESALYLGNSGGLTMAARRGDPAPGTAGAAFNSSWRSYSNQNTTYNANGRVAFNAALSGGDTVTANNAGIFTGPVGSIGMVVRKGDTVQTGVTISNLGFNVKMNANNQVFFDPTLAGAGVTTANDSALYVHTPGFGNTRIWREGDAAPGTAGAVFSGPAGPGQRSFSTAGLLHTATLTGGDVVGTTNNNALYVSSPVSQQLIARQATTPAPGTDGLFGVFNSSSLSMSNSGWMTFQASITGGTQTAATDTGMWGGFAGNFNLIFREGDIAPGTVGAQIDSMTGKAYAVNNNGQVVMNVGVIGGDVDQTTFLNNKVLYGWTPGVGLTVLARSGDSFEVTPGNFKTIANFAVQNIDTAGGATQSLNDLGQVCVNLSFTDNSNAILRTYVPTPGTLGLGAVGCLAMLRRRRR